MLKDYSSCIFLHLHIYSTSGSITNSHFRSHSTFNLLRTHSVPARSYDLANMAEFPMFYIGPNLGGSQTTIVNISGPDCKLLLTRLSNVDKRRVVAVLWDHGSIYSPNYDWPISFSLGKEMCKNWINNLSEQDCNSVICELQGSGLLEGGTSRIAGAVVSLHLFSVARRYYCSSTTTAAQ